MTFAMLLKGVPSRVYSSLLIKSLLDLFWTKIQMSVIQKLFLPYCAFAMTAIAYFNIALQSTNYDEESFVSKCYRITLLMLASILWCYLVVFHFMYFKRLSNKRKYFSDFWNWIDLISYITSALVIIISLQETPII